MTYLNLKPVEFDAMGKKNQQAFKWEGRILLPKYDGCFAMMAFHEGFPDFIMSRTGEAVRSMDHLYEQMMAAYPFIGKLRGGWMILGEAWNPAYEFSELSGMFRRQSGVQAELGFAPFDVVRYERESPSSEPKLWSTWGYAERLAMLTDCRPVSPLVYCPAPVICEGREHAMRYAKTMKDKGGYDGAIAGDPAAIYTPGAGKGGEFIKLKPLVSYSLRCVGYEEDRGAKTGRPTGALIVVCGPNNARCKVATGLSEAEQANLGQFSGKIVEVEAMGRSSKGLLREPRFKGVRHDVTKADY